MDIAKLQVIIETKGAKEAAEIIAKMGNNAGKAEKQTNSLTSSMKLLSGVAVGAYLANIGKEALKATDSMKLLESRVNLVASATDNYTKIQKELLQIANSNRTSLDSVGQLYVKLKDPIAKLGGTTQTALDITNAFSKTLLLSGVNAQEASSATLQFAQAMASGVLRGDEFRSIAEASPKVLKVLSAELGVTSGELRKMSEDGKLTAGVVGGALLSSYGQLEKEVKSISPTIGGAFEIMKNEAVIAAEKIDKVVGANQLFIDGITSLTESIKLMPTIFEKYDGTIDAFTKKHAYAYEVVKKLGDLIGMLGDKTLDTGEKIGTSSGNLAAQSASGFIGWIDNIGKTLEYYGLLSIKIDEINNKPSIVPPRPFEEKKEKQAILDMTAFQREEMRQRSIDTLKYNAELEVQRQKDIEKAKKDAEKAQKDAEKVAEQWADRKREIAYNVAIAEQDELAKPFILLQKKYDEDMLHFKGIKEAQLKLTEEYNAEVQRLNKDTVEKFNKQEEEKAKKSAEWQVKIFEANEKLNDDLIKLNDNAYGKSDNIDSWYQNQLEWLGKLSQEVPMTTQQINELLSKIEAIKAVKLEQQTISFKVEQSFYKSFEQGLTDSIEDAFNGKLNLKSFFKTIQNSMVSTLSSSLSSSFTKSLFGGGVSLTGALSALGAASAIGTQLSASELTDIASQSGTIVDEYSGVMQTSGGTVIDAGGKVTSAGSDIMSLVSGISTLKTAYDVLSGGLSSSVLKGFTGVSSGLSNLGFTGLAGGLTEFGVGFASPFATLGAAGATASPLAGLYGSGIAAAPTGLTTLGAGLSAGLMGGAVGYGVGSLGDMLFGAQTKAGIGGAIGGASGALIGSQIGVIGGPLGMLVGSLAGSLLGGIFGTKKTTDVGLEFSENITSLTDLSAESVKQYSDWQKKSWFSSKRGTDYSNLDSNMINQIEGIFDTYDYLLMQLGDLDRITLAAGKYSKDTFQDAIIKNFITAFTDISQTSDDTIYQAWVDYAESINKTVTEAFTESINSFIQSKRTFEFWSLGDSVEALAKKAKWANADFENLANTMGTTGVTVDNFLSMYEEAVKNSFTPETISQWNSLGSALMSATDASKAYTTALEQEAETVRLKAEQELKAQSESAYQTAINSLNAISTLNTQILGLEVQKALVQKGITQDNLDSLELQKSGIEDIVSMAQNMRDRLLGADNIQQAYQRVLIGARTDFASGNYQSANIDRLGDVASSYADFLQNTALSEADYKLGVLSLANEIEGITKGGASLDSVQSEIERVAKGLDLLTPTIEDQLTALNAQKDAYVTQTEKQINVLNALLGSDSPMLNVLRTALDSVIKGGAVGTGITSSNLTGTLSTVADIYTKQDLNKYQSDTSGYEYWVNEVKTGALSTIQLETAIKNASSTIKTVESIYSKYGLDKYQTDVSGYKYWDAQVASGNLTLSQLDETIKKAAIQNKQIDGSHANGLSYVPYDGYVAQLHKGERVVTASENSMVGGMVNELKAVKQLMVKLVADNTKQLSTQRALLSQGIA